MDGARVLTSPENVDSWRNELSRLEESLKLKTVLTLAFYPKEAS
jgi:hypothetical protein